MSLLCVFASMGSVSKSHAFEGTPLLTTQQYTVTRQGRFLLISLHQPFRVLSTSAVNGGVTEHVRYLANHQSMEGKGHDARLASRTGSNRREYHAQVANELQVPAGQLALMGTAASMDRVAMVRESFRSLTVTALVTAGVANNARRAGDPASWYQSVEGDSVVNRKVVTEAAGNVREEGLGSGPADDEGTINTVVLVNQPLTPASLTRLMMVATEAKTSVLQDLSIASRYSVELSTGTGTDQLVLAAPLATTEPELPSASGHLKLGELAGKAVRAAVAEALALQNGLTVRVSPSVLQILGRYGFDLESLNAALDKYLGQHPRDLASSNLPTLMRDQGLIAAAQAYAVLLDSVRQGRLSAALAPETLRNQAAMAAVAVSGRPEQWPYYRQRLALRPPSEPHTYVPAIDLFAHAIALGWEDKWAR